MKSIFRYCLVALMFVPPALGQNASRPEFEVSSVKPSDPTNLQDSYMPTLDVRPGGTLRIVNRRLDEIIEMPWLLCPRPNQMEVRHAVLAR